MEFAINGVVVEDQCWLRKKNDEAHIKVAELKAVVKIMSLVDRANLQELEITSVLVGYARLLDMIKR